MLHFSRLHWIQDFIDGFHRQITFPRGRCFQAFSVQRCLKSWTRSPPNRRIPKQQVIDPWGAMTAADVYNAQILIKDFGNVSTTFVLMVIDPLSFVGGEKAKKQNPSLTAFLRM
jgi:hypothetical protein